MKDLDQKNPRRVLIIANPRAGRANRAPLPRIVQALRDRACDVRIQVTADRGDAERLASKITIQDADVLAVAGGDGTMNEVLNGLVGDAPPIAIIPVGTANVLAAEIGLRATVDAIADTIISGQPSPICLGLVNGRRFAVMASLGLDAQVVRDVNLKLKRFIGKGAYVYETFHQLAAFDPPAFDLVIDNQPHKAYGVVVANGRYFGGRFVVAPKACIKKPSLDVCCGISGGRMATLRYMASMLQGHLADRPDYRIIDAKTLEIRGPMGATVQADGDVIASLPARIGIQPEAVTLMFPQDAAPASASRPPGYR